MSQPDNSGTVLSRLTGRPDTEGRRALTCVCTAHPDVLRIVLDDAIKNGEPMLIEATCNQVNHRGGYTGMTPAAFRGQVLSLLDKAGGDPSQLVLAGDHLGPNPWKHLSSEEAIREAEAMVRAYVAAGFKKIHLDTSMPCADDAGAMSDELVAERAARLAKVAESTCRELRIAPPLYIIGTEVPPPGGAVGHTGRPEVTRAASALRTVEIHRDAFARSFGSDIFARVIGLVVQPGVEFGDDEVAIYEPAQAAELAGALRELPGMTFEAHSTDYQPASALRSLASDGFALLKVGPALTFAWREAIYGLDLIRSVETGLATQIDAAMERLMTDEPAFWRPYFAGNEREIRAKRHYSYSDRIRYYWPHPRARRSVDELLAYFGTRRISRVLISQFLGARYDDFDGSPTAGELIEAAVGAVLRDYRHATYAS